MAKNDAAHALQEFQDAARKGAQAAFVRALEIITLELNREGVKPDFALQAARELKNVAGAEPEKKADPYANLATFTITLIGATAQVAAQPASLVGVVGEAQPPRLSDVEDAKLLTFTPNPSTLPGTTPTPAAAEKASPKKRGGKPAKEPPRSLPASSVDDDLMAMLG